MIERFSKYDFQPLCQLIAERDVDLRNIISTIGYPPYWTRPNSFATLVLTILEQQVSLQSAFAAFTKLKQKIKIVSPQNVLRLMDEELRHCYFSRQKIGYVKGLARALVTKQIVLKKLYHQPDDEVRATLKTLKGIGDWTVDIYLIHALHRRDIFPIGDLALVKAFKEVKNLLPRTTKDELIELGEQWKPYRSIATMILWHHYLQKRSPVTPSPFPT
jgi:DNA-3-methyladenine glycosylase II